MEGITGPTAKDLVATANPVRAMDGPHAGLLQVHARSVEQVQMQRFCGNCGRVDDTNAPVRCTHHMTLFRDWSFVTGSSF